MSFLGTGGWHVGEIVMGVPGGVGFPGGTFIPFHDSLYGLVIDGSSTPGRTNAYLYQVVPTATKVSNWKVQLVGPSLSFSSSIQIVFALNDTQMVCLSESAPTSPRNQSLYVLSRDGDISLSITGAQQTVAGYHNSFGGSSDAFMTVWRASDTEILRVYRPASTGNVHFVGCSVSGNTISVISDSDVSGGTTGAVVDLVEYYGGNQVMGFGCHGFACSEDTLWHIGWTPGGGLTGADGEIHDFLNGVYIFGCGIEGTDQVVVNDGQITPSGLVPNGATFDSTTDFYGYPAVLSHIPSTRNPLLTPMPQRDYYLNAGGNLYTYWFQSGVFLTSTNATVLAPYDYPSDQAYRGFWNEAYGRHSGSLVLLPVDLYKSDGVGGYAFVSHDALVFESSTDARTVYDSSPPSVVVNPQSFVLINIATYTNAVNGVGAFLSSGEASVGLTKFDATRYRVDQGFLYFDTTSIGTVNNVRLEFLSVGSGTVRLRMATYNFGPPSTSEWHNPAQLAALTPFLSVTLNPTADAGSGFPIQIHRFDLDPSLINAGGITKFICWDQDQQDMVVPSFTEGGEMSFQGSVGIGFEEFQPTLQINHT